MVQPRFVPQGTIKKGPDVLPMDAFSTANRERLSGPAIRIFANVADEWRLSEAERLAILGQPPRSTLYAWIKKGNEKEALCLPLDVLIRISLVIGIYKALEILLINQADRVAWLRNNHNSLTFGNQAPISFMTGPSQDGLFLVRRYLDAWRGGRHSTPLADLDVDSMEPLTDDDIVLV